MVDEADEVDEEVGDGIMDDGTEEWRIDGIVMSSGMGTEGEGVVAGTGRKGSSLCCDDGSYGVYGFDMESLILDESVSVCVPH